VKTTRRGKGGKNGCGGKGKKNTIGKQPYSISRERRGKKGASLKEKVIPARPVVGSLP